MEFRVLGVLEALEDGLPISLGGPKQRSVLAMLLLDPNRSVSTDRLVDGLWGDEPPLRPAATLQVLRLEPAQGARAGPRPPRRAVGAADAATRLSARRRPRADRPLPLRASSVAFARALVVRRVRRRARPSLFREALALWREAPLADLANEPFARFEMPRLEEARTRCDRRPHRRGPRPRPRRRAAPRARSARRRAIPYRERLRRQLMLALYRAGRQADALAAYQAARQRARRGARSRDRAVSSARWKPRSWSRSPTLAPAEPAPIGADDGRACAPRRERRQSQTPTSSKPSWRKVGTPHGERRKRSGSAIDHEQTSRLSATLEAAGATQVELVRARRVDRRPCPRPAQPARAAPRYRPGRPNRPGSPAVGPCPYKGLLRFEPEDAGWYFGRERLVAELLATVASTRCTGVVGASGSGKSSLTRAGLLAALDDDALPGSARVAAPARHPRRRSDARARARARTRLSCRVTRPRPRPAARGSRVAVRIRRPRDERGRRRRVGR